MATSLTPLQNAQYYANLLILQYLGKSNAYNTVLQTVSPALMPQTSVQTLSLSGIPASGSFTLTSPYSNQTTAALNWNYSANQIQTALQALTGLGSTTVTGSLASQSLIVTFNHINPTDIYPIAPLLVVATLTLKTSGSVAIAMTVAETDILLPFAIQGGFNIESSTSPNSPFYQAVLAIGTQLNIVGEYAGVTRSGIGFYGNLITLSDADFLTLIQMAIILNNAYVPFGGTTFSTPWPASLSTIQSFLAQYFNTGVSPEILVFDYSYEGTVMRMSYLISSAIGSQNLVQMFVIQGLLPRPLGVQLGVIYNPTIVDFFAFITYVNQSAFNNQPYFNTYPSYSQTIPLVTYAMAVQA